MRRIALAAGFALASLMLASSLLRPSSPARTRTISAAPSPSPTPLVANRPTSGLRTYAIALTELSGLPADASPGTVLEVWATWEPPLTKRPRIDKLIGRALLERIVPAATPDGPASALLSVGSERVPDLIWGDRYGQLSAVLLPEG